MNRKKSRIYSLICTVTLFTLLMSMTAFAADAVTDILNKPRFEGAVGYVNKLGDLVDESFMAVISFVSFFIISASCLRNVLAGAYCVFPKFWDKVHEAHEQAKLSELSIKGVASGFKGIGDAKAGTVATFLLALLPDIKVLTDFENAQDIDYKQYFMKAIPQCVVAVFIGVFLYNGLYRDVMSITSRFGVAVTDNFLTSVKPEQVLEDLTNIRVNINYGVKGSPSGTRYIADQMHKALVGYPAKFYTDQSKAENKTILYQHLSDTLESYCAANFGSFANTDEWAVEVTQGILTDSPVPKQNVVSEDGMTHTYYVSIPVNDKGNSNSLQLNTSFEDVRYLECTVTFSNKGASASASSISASYVEFTIGGMNGGRVSFNGQKGASISSGTGTNVKYGNHSFTVSVDSSNNVSIEAHDNISNNERYQASGSEMIYATEKVKLPIRAITFASSGQGCTVSFKDESGNTILTSAYGDDVTQQLLQYSKTASKNTGNNNSNQGANEGDDDDVPEDADS